MLQAIKEMLAELMSSKKFVALLAGVLLLLARRFGLDLDEETANKIIALIGTYIVGQGLADLGKSKAKIEATEDRDRF